MPHRTYNVARGNDGFSLSVIDETWSGFVVETATEGLLDLLGHPCCGKGPLNRLHLSYRTLWRTGILRLLGGLDVLNEEGEWQLDPDEDALELFWWRVMNLPNRLHCRVNVVAQIPLAREEALAIRPDIAEWESEDDDE